MREEFFVDTLVLLDADDEGVEEVKRSTDELTIMLWNVSVGADAASKPFDQSELKSAVDDLREHLENGLTVVVSNCPASIEAHLFTACLLVGTGVEPEMAASCAGLDPEEDESEYEMLLEFAAGSDSEPTTLLERCKAHFISRGKRYHRFQDKPLLEIFLGGRSGTFACYVSTYEDTQQVVAVACAPIRIPADRRAEVCEYACRVNFNWRIGCLEMDMSDGEVHFRAGIDVEGGELTETMMKNLMASAFCGMDRHLPPLLSVAYGGSRPRRHWKHSTISERWQIR
ncbi:MAG: YbjN domain-containing protein [Trueperaceae bacterium]